MSVVGRFVLHFPHTLVGQPIMCRLAKEVDIEFNILKASVTPNEEGLLVVEFSGGKHSFKKGMDYLSRMGVRIQLLSKDVIRNEDKCTHCGSCVMLCTGGALSVDRLSMKVNFDHTKCTACEICIKSCPLRAMEIHF